MSIVAKAPLEQPPVLPMTAEEMAALGWKELDILLVSGDAYVDHPSFAVALLGRWLAANGYRVGIVAQPEWQGEEALHAITCMGRPRLYVGIAAGAIDSMLARYTAFRKQRSDDAYTPGGLAGKRPNRAVTVYANMARRVFPGVPLVLGGIEASLRRASHYDFWADALRRSILLDAKADLLIYGMGERAVVAAAAAAEEALAHVTATGAPMRAAFAERARHIPGTASLLSRKEADALFPPGVNAAVRLPSHEAILKDPFQLVAATVAMERQVHQGKQYALQESGDRILVMTPPSRPLETADLDALYDLPYSRLPHPSYAESIPAWEMIRTSITSHRGCGGGCAFCSLALHQTRRIASRSKESVLREARHIAATEIHGKIPAWAGSISDVGGPSANMWRANCAKEPETCKRASCLFPSVCSSFKVDQAEGAAMLREVAAQSRVRHVRIASGVRFDLALSDPEALAAYTQEFTGGQLKIAPEHIAEPVLRLMRKPSLTVFETFIKRFESLSKAVNKQQYVIPYLMSAFPGCTDEDMRALARWLKERNWSPRQVQCFIPTPGTVATAIFYAGRDMHGNPVHVARTDAERMRQHYILLGSEKNSRKRGDKTRRRHDSPNCGNEKKMRDIHGPGRDQMRKHLPGGEEKHPREKYRSGLQPGYNSRKR